MADSSQIESLLDLLQRVLRACNRVANRPAIRVDFEVVAAGEALVTKEVDVLILNSASLLFGGNVVEAICLVPAGGEYVE